MLLDDAYFEDRSQHDQAPYYDEPVNREEDSEVYYNDGCIDADNCEIFFGDFSGGEIF